MAKEGWTLKWETIEKKYEDFLNESAKRRRVRRNDSIEPDNIHMDSWCLVCKKLLKNPRICKEPNCETMVCHDCVKNLH